VSGAVVDVEDYWDAAGGGSRLGPEDEGGRGLLQPKSVIRAKLLSLAQGLRGAKTSRGKWMKDLERENSRLKKAVADLTWTS